MKSKLGLGVILAFLVLIAFAFALSDVASSWSFGGVAGGDRVAAIGDDRISTSDLSSAATGALDQIREQRPTISMQAFISQGGLTDVLEQMIDRRAIAEYAREHGIRASDNLVNSEIRQMGAFRGVDGNFDEQAFRQALANQGVSEEMLREDLASGLLVQQILTPSSFGTTMPDALAKRYAQLFKERRLGAISFLPSAAYSPKGEPSAEQLKAYYEANDDDFIRPERRTIRYAAFDAGAIKQSIEPTEDEISKRYERDSAKYAAKEEITFSQLIVPTQEAASSIRKRVLAGASLEQVAQEAGFRVASRGPVTRADLQTETSKGVADAYFAAGEGNISQPAQSALGWHIARVNKLDKTAARGLAEVHDEIATTLRDEKRAQALADLAAKVEDQFEDGATLGDVAGQLDLKLAATKPVTANGGVYGEAGQRAPEVLQPALATAFQMDESQPQIVQINRGTGYLLFEVSEITESAPAPLAEIKEDVVRAWRMAEGAKLAKQAADRILARVGKDAELSAAVEAEAPALPPVDRINLSREELARTGAQRVPAPLALLFSMAKGTSKKLQAPDNIGWFVVKLDEVKVEELPANDPLIAQAKNELGRALGNEYNAQLVAAMRKELGVERNAAAIEAVRKQLLGER